MLTGAEIRTSFLEFFKQNGHSVLPSSSLVPDNDPTLMFTNSGMVQFKNNFAGLDKSLSRAATSQRCVRAGGKHNDLDNVGHTARHHTFFEMLGNFSFGDYFKEDAITWGWQWVTEELKIDPTRLCVTVYHDDDEAFDIWNKKIGVAEKDIIRIATSDNFWTMGDTGPCGPCSEIFYDYGDHIWGGRPGTPEEDGDRFVEIWNLVFTQYDLQKDGSKLLLPSKNIDTGAGLERIMSVAQGVTSNYDTDVFQTIIQEIARQAGVTYGQGGQNNNNETDVALRVIADHLRCMSFLIVDGVMPSNEGRGYVLRRIMRRAMRYVHMMGIEKPFIYNLLPVLVQVMGDAYPELARGARMVQDVVKLEEERFGRTLKQGMKILNEESAGLKAGDTLAGEVAFKLYDTYGFPLDLTADALRSRDIQIDEEGFSSEMSAQKQRARAAHKGSGDAAVSDVWFEIQEEIGATEFQGYTRTKTEAVVAALESQGKRVEALNKGESGTLIVAQTPFYGESGGQVGDIGTVTWDGGNANVTDVQKVLDGLFLHKITVTEGALKTEANVELQVDKANRAKIEKNHSVTHLLHLALRETLGDHVFQKGSKQDGERTRFDISHPKALSAEEMYAVETRVNSLIWGNYPVETKLMTKDEAVEQGAMALFGEKYGEEVRVVKMGPSVELCGGTHVKNTGDIGLFKLLSDSAVAAGIRRIEGTTHMDALQAFSMADTTMKQVSHALNVKPEELADRATALQKENKKLKQEAKKNTPATAGVSVKDFLNKAEDINGVKVVLASGIEADSNTMRSMMDELKQQLGSGIALLVNDTEEKVTLMCGVTKDLTKTYQAGKLVNVAAQALGGKGGGRPDFAQAGAPKGDIALAFGALKEAV